MSEIGAGITAIALAVIGLAALAVILSHGSNTANVISQAGSGLAQLIGAAQAPILGASNMSAYGNGFASPTSFG